MSKIKLEKLNTQEAQQTAMKLYCKVLEIVDCGDDVEIKKIKGRLKVSKVSRKSDLEVAIEAAV